MFAPNKKHNPNVAFCVGDLNAAKPLLTGLCDEFMKLNINLHVFHGFTSCYDGEPQDIAQTNIYNLPNYDMIDMLIVAPFYLSTDTGVISAVIDRAKKAGKPVLTIGTEYEGCYCIKPDYTTQIELITEHFIKVHKFTDIYFISGIKGEPVAEQRLAGYKRAFEKNGIPLDESKIYYGDFWEKPTIKAIDSMLSDAKKPPQAIVCGNDTMALTAMIRLSELGYKVPEDICISGMDGIAEAEGFVTTAKIFSAETGVLAARMVNDILSGKKQNTDVIEPINIIYGESCGCVEENKSINFSKRHALFENMYDARIYSKSALRHTQELANSGSFDELNDRLVALMAKMWVKNSWLCICKDFMTDISVSSIDSAEDATKSASGAVHLIGYCEQMCCPVRYIDKTLVGECVFDTEQMLPDFYNAADNSKVILYSPLHVRDNTIGYLAFDFYPWSNIIHVLNILTVGISNVLESVRRQNELYAYAKKVDELYITDSLTKLYNRRGFFRLYSDYLNNPDKTDCMIISIDLDNLKQINDNYGHSEGDNAIVAMAQAMLSTKADGDVCARFGGDEYVVFGCCKSEEYLNDYVNRIFEYIEQFNKTSGKPYNVHASCGSCIVPRNADKHIDYYINAADSKMYLNKEKHKRTRMLHLPDAQQ